MDHVRLRNPVRHVHRQKIPLTPIRLPEEIRHLHPLDPVTGTRESTAQPQVKPRLRDSATGSYSSEIFKNGGAWLGRNEILSKSIIPITSPATQNSLGKIILNGDVGLGFTRQTIDAAQTDVALREVCEKLKNFLSSFLISNDEIAARFAILKLSPYDDLPNLRAGSQCFDDTEIEALGNMNPSFKFSNKERVDPTIRDLNNRMTPLSLALISLSKPSIKDRVSSNESFSFFSGETDAVVVRGDAAVEQLAKAPGIFLSCYQAAPTMNLSVIGALARYGSKKTGAIFVFDDSGKVSSIRLMAPDDVANVLGIDKDRWLDPKTNACLPKVGSTQKVAASSGN